MRCPFCHTDNDRVCDSRAINDGFGIRRRRECQHCHRRYTTHEQVAEMSIKVVKKDEVRVPFDREKIKLGILKACWKRPIKDEQIEETVSAIEREIYGHFDTEIASGELGELVMKHLRQLDEVAYVRFASVYRQFQHAHDFVDELAPMLQESRRNAEKK